MTGLAALVLGVALLQQAQADVSASLSNNRVAIGETTLLQVTVEASGGRPDRIELPALDPTLDVVSSREYLQTQLSLPGGRTTIFRRDIVLRPTREGTFVIPPVIVNLADGSQHRTSSLTLLVLPASRRAPGPLAPAGTTAPAADAGELRTTLEPDTVWVGQPALLRLAAVIPEEQRTRRGRAPAFEPPIVPGFWVEELEDRGAVGVRAIGPVYYDIHEYRRLYVPLNPGVHVFPPGRAVYETERGWMFSPETHELEGDTVRLHVRALPAAGRPEAFTGAVGDFEVRATIEPRSLAPGDAATLTVEVEGTGNIKALPPPHLPELPGIDVYPPTEDATLTARTSGIRGVKRFRWVLVPERGGTLELPAVTYAWFDPDAAAYRSATVELPAITVHGIATDAARSDSALAPLRTSPQPAQHFAWASTRAFAVLQALPLVLLAGALIWRRQGPRLQERRGRTRRRSIRFDGARERIRTDPRDALRVVELALQDGLIELAGAVHADALHARGVPPALVGDIDTLRADLARTRFRPEAVPRVEAEELLERAMLLLARTQRAVERPRTAAAPALLAVLLLQPAATASGFDNAVVAYERGDWDTARAGFVAHLQSHPHDAAAWYDLGNTDFRRGVPGLAVHAWAHALRLEPRADDIQRNLRAADAREALLAARRPIPVTVHELRALAGIAWLLGGVLLAVRVLGRGQGARRTGVAATVALTVTAVVLLALLAQHAWPAHGVVVRETTVRAGPVMRAEPRATLPAAATARIVATEGDWVRIRAGTEEGWIERRDLARF